MRDITSGYFQRAGGRVGILDTVVPRVRTKAVKVLVKGVARLPYRKDAENLPSRILNRTSESSLRGLIGIARSGMKRRVREAHMLGQINAAQRLQREQFLENLFHLVETGFLRLAPNVKRALVNSLIMNNMELANIRRMEFAKKYGHWPPTLLVISPTMACNLKCVGCYAFQYEKGSGLDNDTIDSIIEQAQEAGIYFIVVSGGEPFVRKNDMLRMARKYQDNFFLFYTNGTLIDSSLAQELADVGNIAPSVSVEGFREETDSRRGAGIFDKVVRAMRELRENGVFFGFSFTALKSNHDVLVGKRLEPETGCNFIEFWMALQGACYGWVFQYIPIGRSPDPNLLPTPEQTVERGAYVRRIREKGYVVADFWNDGYLAGPSVCMAGARNYFHINASGDVEPCVFAHYCVPGHNVHEKSLVDIIESDYFRCIRSRTIDNPMRPCMLIHHPELMREDYVRFGLRDTDGEPSLVRSPEVVKKLDEWSMEYGRLADEAHRLLLLEAERRLSYPSC